ncbi:VWA domain-containing protein [Tunturibacter empetritectus]|uniref:VWFA-related protein n=1 Tax=Tunturiibacter empetritectus TaxID=3069691 RepID=A0A7W8MR53_9BACT|nr:VWA domain-containing protein [Edaphobacter lichenicola]MBB5317456.1 VWFA-related protein [Edaphobacter lichenicola]
MKLRLREFVAFVSVWTSAAFAQTTLHTTTTLVVVPTLVQTPGKELVYSLKADDFVLADNGVPQKVTLEEETQRPVSLVVLMQTGGDARGQFLSYANLDTMLGSLIGGAPNEVSIVNFDSKAEAASPFTSNVAEWGEAIDHPDVGDNGAAIFDGISFGLDLLSKRPIGNRRAILLISQEHDDGSNAAMKDIVRELGETNTAIYSVTFSAEKTAARQAFKDPAHLNPPLHVGEGDYQAYFNLSEPLRLIFGAMRKNTSAELATLSGGEWNSFDNLGELTQDLGVLTNHLHNSYVLSFTPTSAAPGLHTISVRLARHPEMVVSARSNYWAAEAESNKQRNFDK